MLQAEGPTGATMHALPHTFSPRAPPSAPPRSQRPALSQSPLPEGKQRTLAHSSSTLSLPNDHLSPSLPARRPSLTHPFPPVTSHLPASPPAFSHSPAQHMVTIRSYAPCRCSASTSCIEPSHSSAAPPTRAHSTRNASFSKPLNSRTCEEQALTPPCTTRKATGPGGKRVNGGRVGVEDVSN